MPNVRSLNAVKILEKICLSRNGIRFRDLVGSGLKSQMVSRITRALISAGYLDRERRESPLVPGPLLREMAISVRTHPVAKIRTLEEEEQEEGRPPEQPRIPSKFGLQRRKPSRKRQIPAKNG